MKMTGNAVKRLNLRSKACVWLTDSLLVNMEQSHSSSWKGIRFITRNWLEREGNCTFRPFLPSLLFSTDCTWSSPESFLPSTFLSWVYLLLSIPFQMWWKNFDFPSNLFHFCHFFFFLFDSFVSFHLAVVFCFFSLFFFPFLVLDHASKHLSNQPRHVFTRFLPFIPCTIFRWWLQHLLSFQIKHLFSRSHTNPQTLRHFSVFFLTPALHSISSLKNPSNSEPFFHEKYWEGSERLPFHTFPSDHFLPLSSFPLFLHRLWLNLSSLSHVSWFYFVLFLLVHPFQ